MKLNVFALPLLFLCSLFSSQLFANSILKFEGVYKYQAILFNWELTKNITFQLKEIERSSDSINFYTCISFASSNTKMIAWDKEPLTGKSFYRLKVIDSFGNIELSSVIVINVRIWFNWQQKNNTHFNSDLTEKKFLFENEKYKIVIYDLNGNIKESKEISNIDHFNPEDFLYAVKKGEPNVFIVMKDEKIIQRRICIVN